MFIVSRDKRTNLTPGNGIRPQHEMSVRMDECLRWKVLEAEVLLRGHVHLSLQNGCVFVVPGEPVYPLAPVRLPRGELGHLLLRRADETEDTCLRHLERTVDKSHGRDY